MLKKKKNRKNGGMMESSINCTAIMKEFMIWKLTQCQFPL